MTYRFPGAAGYSVDFINVILHTSLRCIERQKQFSVGLPVVHSVLRFLWNHRESMAVAKRTPYVHKETFFCDGVPHLPLVTKEFLGYLKDLPVKSDDIFVATYPKSGTCLTNLILCSRAIVYSLLLFIGVYTRTKKR